MDIKVFVFGRQIIGNDPKYNRSSSFGVDRYYKLTFEVCYNNPYEKKPIDLTLQGMVDINPEKTPKLWYNIGVWDCENSCYVQKITKPGIYSADITGIATVSFFAGANQKSPITVVGKLAKDSE